MPTPLTSARFPAYLPLLALLLPACIDNKVTIAHKTEVFEQAPSNEVDILWIIDNSVSMVQEQTAVANGAQEFVGHLEETGMDFHLGVVTSDLDVTNTNAGAILNGYVSNTTPNYTAEFAQRVQVGTGGSDQEKGLQAVTTALLPPLVDTKNVGFLRDDASLAVIIMSDENDCSDAGALGADSTGEQCYTEYQKLTAIPDLVSEMNSIKHGSIGSFTLSGIIGPDAVDGCADAVPGKRYATAIEMIGGVRANICDADFTSIMDSLGLIAAGILDTFPLENLAKEGTIEVAVDDVDGNEIVVGEDVANGWTYEQAEDSSSASIVFHGTGIPPRGATITVDYDYGGALQDPDTGA